MLLLTALFNGLLAALCGWRFKILVFIPLFAITGIELIFFKLAGIGPSPFWSGLALITSIELGYLVGAALRQVRIPSRRRKARNQHNRLLLI